MQAAPDLQPGSLKGADLSRRHAGAIGLLALLCLAPCRPAHAELSGRADSVAADSAHLSAAMVTTAYADYTEYTLTLPNGGVVREFADSGGDVFAVAWQGPSRPDLRQLLGAHFDALQSDNAPSPLHPRHRRTPLSVSRTDFVVHSSGRPGAFRGLAYVPQAVPAGFSVDDIK